MERKRPLATCQGLFSRFRGIQFTLAVGVATRTATLGGSHMRATEPKGFWGLYEDISNHTGISSRCALCSAPFPLVRSVSVSFVQHAQTRPLESCAPWLMPGARGRRILGPTAVQLCSMCALKGLVCPGLLQRCQAPGNR